MADLPPAFITTAAFDPLRDEGEAYGRKLCEAGVPVTVHRFDGMMHAFFQLSRFLEDRAAVAESAAALGTAIRDAR